MVNASRRAGLGRTLQKAQRQATQRRNPRKSDRHTVEANPENDARLKLKSVTAQTNLDEFFEEADLAGKQFITERRNVALIDEDGDQRVDLYDEDERLEDIPKAKLEDIDRATSLAVPRRPKWDANTTPEQLDEYEKLTFLTWRKRIAKLQENENVVLTPFEKNIEVWRQLWRVVERSDVVVQILDCRNPLLYLCDDLIKYVNEEFQGKKLNLILLNKADYLTKEQRQMWLDYFKHRNLKVIFFSALLESANISNNSGRRASESENNHPHELNDDDLDDDEVAHNLDKTLKFAEHEDKDETRIYNKFELLDEWHEILKDADLDRYKTNEPPIHEEPGTQRKVSEVASEHSLHPVRPPTVGLVGYPNVGKSSTINALLSAKRVAVSATPGKTKHFQTFFIDKDLMLCDCPGLVFPNFVGCKSEMVVNGVLPIDQMKDHIGPVRLIVERVPRAFLEEIYGLAFDIDAKQNIIAEDLLNAFGFMRGYMTARGLPDTSRAARKICKDYINGKILYCEPPPNADKRLYHSYSKLADAMRRIEERSQDPKTALMITERQRRLMAQAKGTQISSRDFDAQFFLAKSSGIHIKGLPGIGNMTQPIGSSHEMKVAKREKKHKKKEKLRVVYRDLDL